MQIAKGNIIHFSHFILDRVVCKILGKVSCTCSYRAQGLQPFLYHATGNLFIQCQTIDNPTYVKTDSCQHTTQDIFSFVEFFLIVNSCRDSLIKSR